MVQFFFQRFAIFVFVLAFGFSCQGENVLLSNPPSRVKNIILMIGDGMGPQEVSQALYWRRLTQPKDKKLHMEWLYDNGVSGTVNTWSYKNIVTDSAAAATAMACGFKTRNGILGLGPNGEKCDSVLSLADRLGKSTGLVSNTRLSHATPAAFVAADASRNNENEIAEKILSTGIVDVLLNGGARHLTPQNTKFSQIPGCERTDPRADGVSKRFDDKNIFETARQSGYRFVCTAEQLAGISLAKGEKLLGIFANTQFPMIQERATSLTVPSLSNMTAKSLEVLSKNENGFFLMVEGGLIDFAGHANDAGTLLLETLDFDHAIGVALDYVKNHEDTLLIVTADHESGGFSYSYRQYLKGDDLEVVSFPDGTVYQAAYPPVKPDDVFGALGSQKSSFSGLFTPYLDKIYKQGEDPSTLTDNFRMDVKDKIGFEITPEESYWILTKQHAFAVERSDVAVFHSEDALEEIHSGRLAKILSPQNFVTWSTGTHTAVAVPILAFGSLEAAAYFDGNIENTAIAEQIKRLWNTP